MEVYTKGHRFKEKNIPAVSNLILDVITGVELVDVETSGTKDYFSVRLQGPRV